MQPADDHNESSNQYPITTYDGKWYDIHMTWMLAGPHSIKLTSFLSRILCKLSCTWKHKYQKATKESFKLRKTRTSSWCKLGDLTDCHKLNDTNNRCHVSVKKNDNSNLRYLDKEHFFLTSWCPRYVTLFEKGMLFSRITSSKLTDGT